MNMNVYMTLMNHSLEGIHLNMKKFKKCKIYPTISNSQKKKKNNAIMTFRKYLENRYDF